MLIKANGFDPGDFLSWVFYPGMLFNSPDKWWGDFGRRDFAHEGIDFCLYKDRAGRLLRLDQQTRIPVMHDGMVRAMFADYLGIAVVIEHTDAQNESQPLLSVYAHTHPLEGIQPGVVVRRGDVIATIADTSQSKAKIAPHMHYSLGRPSPDLIYDPFVWNIMRDPDRVELLNPIYIIDWPYQILDHRHHG